MIIGLCGRAGAGKDTVGQILVDHYGYTAMAFADPLREMALALNPIIEPVYSEPRLGSLRLKPFVESFGWTQAKANPEVRRFMQALGTDAVRNVLGDNTWSDYALKRIWGYSDAKIVFTDVRFPNEQDMIRINASRFSKGALILKIERPDASDLGSNANHASETSLDKLSPDATIINDSDIETLEKKIFGFMATSKLVKH